MSAPRRPSLRAVLLATVAVPVVVAVVAVDAVAVTGARRAALTLAGTIQREVGHRVEAELEPWLDVPHALNASNAELFLTAGAPPVDALRRHLWRQVRAAPTVGYVQVGFEADGAFVGVERNEDGSFNLEVTDDPRTGKGVFRLDTDGEPEVARLSFVDGYDARARPWYRAAVRADGPAWSPIYQFSSRQEARLGITAVEPVRDGEGGLVGVAGTDLVLSHLSALLRDAAHDGTVLALAERDGKLVASSVHDRPFEVGQDGTAVRVSVGAGDGVLAAAARGLGDLSTLAYPRTTRVPDPDTFVYGAPLSDGRGLEWVLLVAIPAANVLSEVERDAQRSVWLGLVVLALAAGGGVVVAARLTRPLRQLSGAADALTRGDWAHPLPAAGTVEIDALVRGFEVMRGRLAATLADAEQARVAAEEGNRAKSVFLASMSHELRTPLTAILGYTELLLEATPEGPDAEDLRRVRGAAAHLLGLVDDLLDLARVEAGRIALVVEDVPVGPVVEEVVSHLRPAVEARGNRLEVSVEPGVGSVRADRGRLRQVLINLLGNAGKFTDRGRVRLSADRDGRWVVFEVSDTGVGIPEDQLPSVFEPFRRAKGAEGREGAGLGLAIVQRLVAAMDGAVEVRSRLGQGTTSTVRLPGS